MARDAKASSTLKREKAWFNVRYHRILPRIWLVWQSAGNIPKEMRFVPCYFEICSCFCYCPHPFGKPYLLPVLCSFSVILDLLQTKKLIGEVTVFTEKVLNWSGLSWAWWLTFRKLMEKDCYVFEASLGYTVSSRMGYGMRLCLKNQADKKISKLNRQTPSLASTSSKNLYFKNAYGQEPRSLKRIPGQILAIRICSV